MQHTRQCAFALPACAWLALACASVAQTSNSNTPASVPAGDIGTPAVAKAVPISVTAKQAREADDVYLQGAKHIERKEYEAAEKSFAQALLLNPNNNDYLRAFAFAREGRVMELTHAAAAAKSSGDTAKAATLLGQAHELDPDNRIVAEHISSGADASSPAIDPLRFPPANIASTLAGPVELAPTKELRTFHERGDAQSVLRTVYGAYGITLQFDPSVTAGPAIRFDLQDVSYEAATQLLGQMTKTFVIAVQPKVGLAAKDTQENRDRLIPQVEETIYLRGMTTEQMQDLANLARNVFDVKNITASATAGTILVRSDEPTLRLLNAEYADMLDGGSDVLLDMTLYEIDRTKTDNYGVTFPSSAGVFPIYETAENAITSNQSIIQAAIESKALVLTGNPLVDFLAELAVLQAAGALSPTVLSELTGLLGTVGFLNKIPLLGVSISSGATVTAMLQTSNVNVLDAVELRTSDAQASSFRSGTRYPIETSSYTSGVSSGALSSALAGASASVKALAAQYLGTGGTTTIPQIQFEDLGLTLKATPHILRTGDVSLALDLKIEALGAGSLNGIPVLNNRVFTSTVTVPKGKSALLVSSVNRNETNSVAGFPGLNDLPGFQGTNKDTEDDTNELLIVITPHVIREGKMRITSKRLEYAHGATSF